MRSLMLTLGLTFLTFTIGSADVAAQSKKGSTKKGSIKKAVSSIPQVGSTAQNFKLMGTDGSNHSLSEMTKEGDVVLVVLRGYPGYQCRLCSAQAAEFLQHAQQIQQAGASLVFVYPGPERNLGQKANEFLAKETLPEGVTMLLDPGYEFTNAYGLRWNAPRETAYPSTFVIGQGNKVSFAKVSKTHGGRSKASEVISALN